MIINDVGYTNFNNRLKSKTVPTASTMPRSSSVNFGQAVADYNIKVPMNYTKIGVHKTENGHEIHEYKMANGQKVLIMPMENKFVNLQTYVDTGSLNEKEEERGISHFMEHMMFNGTKGENGYEKLGQNDVFSKTDKMGAYVNACTNYNETSYYTEIPMFNSEDFENAVKIQSSMINNPAFTDEMIEKEKGPVCSEINLYLDIPYAVALEKTIQNLFGIKTNSTNITTGTVENIQNLNAKKLNDYYNANYVPTKMTTIVTGGIDPEKAMQTISKHFRDTKLNQGEQLEEKLTPINKTVRTDLISGKTETTIGIIGFLGPTMQDTKDKICCEAVNTLLAGIGNSRLATPLDEISTSLTSESENISKAKGANTCNFLSYETNEENSEKALKLIYDKLSNFTPPTEKELNNLKLILKTSYEKNFEMPQKANLLIRASMHTGDIKQMTEYSKIVDEITADDIVNTVKKYYNPEVCSITVVHPKEATQESLNNNHRIAGAISFKGKSIQEGQGLDIRHQDKKFNNVNSSISPSFKGGQTEEILSLDKLSRYKLANNTEIGFYDTKTNVGSIGITFACDAPADVKAGVSEILEVMLSRGTAYKNKVEFEDLQNDNCAFYSTGCGEGIISSGVEFLPEKASQVVNLMKENILYPRFTQQDFEEAKKLVKNKYEIKEETSPDYLIKGAFKDQFYGNSKDDVLRNIDSITLSDVMGLHQYYLQNGKSIVGVAGPLSAHPEIKNTIFNELSSLPIMKPNNPTLFDSYKPIEKNEVITKESNKNQADISLGYKYKLSGTLKEDVTLKLLTEILNSGEESGIFNNLREKEKLAYTLYACNTKHDNSALYYLNILTTTLDEASKKPTFENVQKSIDGFKRQIEVMKTGKFTDNELEVAKLKVKSSSLYSSQDTEMKRIVMQSGMNSPEGISRVNEFYKQVDDITKEDVINLANKIFAGKSICAITANKETLASNESYFENLRNS